MEDKNEGKRPGRRFTLKKRNGKAVGIVYTALALCITLAAVLTISSVSSTTIPKTENTKTSDISLDIKKDKRVLVPEPETSEPVSESAVDVEKETSGVPAETKVRYVLPVANGKIDKGYSMTALLYSETMKDYRTHNGIDISGEIGDAVNCYTDGYITDITNDPLMGVSVTVTHAYGLKSVYRNLAETLPQTVYVGAEVKCGDIIGAIGETAIAESCDKPHLHFELILDGKNVNSENELEDLFEE